MALQKLFSLLDARINYPIVVIQHLPDDSITNTAEVYAGSLPNRDIKDVMDKMPLEQKSLYFAPPNYHLLIEKDGTLSLTQDEKVNFSRPSIDVTFQSAAKALGPCACGILLTGANNDGALGLLEIQKNGGMTFVQDPANAVSPAMPKAALELFHPDYVGNLEQISQKLLTIALGE